MHQKARTFLAHRVGLVAHHAFVEQRALQDVADGCDKCRPVLRAWLRGGISEAPVMLQARPVVDTPFERAWRAGAKP